MPAKGSDELFRIIKAMSPAERGYFKKFGDRYVDRDKNNYMELFESIEVMEKYDEKKLLKEKYVNQLPRQKNHLQRLILKSLQAFHADHSLENKIENNIQQIRILHNKGLAEACKRLIEKTKEQCKTGDQFLEHAKVLKQEQHLMKNTGMILEEKHFTRVNTEIIDQLELELNALKYFYLQNHLFAQMHKSGFVRNSSEKNKFKFIIDDPLMRDEKKAASVYSKRIFYNIWSNYYYITNDFPKLYAVSKKYIALKKAEYERSKDVAQYVPGLMNFFLACFQDKRYKECEKVLNVIHSLPANDKGLEASTFGTYLNLKLDLYRAIKTREGSVFIDHIKDRFEKSCPLLSDGTKTSIRYYAFQIKLMSGELKGSLHWMKKLLDGETKECRPDIYLHALIQNLILHYDLGNFELLPYLIKSFEHYLKKLKQQKDFEELMISFFKTILKKNSAPQKQAIETKAKVLHLFKDRERKEAVLRYFDYLTWFESKIKNKSFLELKKTAV